MMMMMMQMSRRRILLYRRLLTGPVEEGRKRIVSSMSRGCRQGEHEGSGGCWMLGS